MNKAKEKTREIRFVSKKNGKLMTVSEQITRDYARSLEDDERIISYEACLPLDCNKYQYVDRLDIRQPYFTTDWLTDFKICCTDGRVIIRELVTLHELSKRSTLEKLEFSRRYWQAQPVDDWKMILVEKGV